MSTESDQRVLREVVLEQLTTGEIRAYRMWLPPLTDPTPVNELVERDHQRRPLRFGLGIMDEPRRHRQEVWGIDTSAAGGNIAVGGAPQTGKSTFLQTLMLSAAASHTPRQVQFYCIDIGGGGLMYLEDLPHVGGVATRSEPDRVNRVVAEMKAILRQRESMFKQHRVGSIAAYRQMRDDPGHPAAADPFGDVYLVIDGWPAFVAEFPDLEPVVQDLAGQGLQFGVHTMISTPRWTELKSRVRDYLGTKIEFRLGDVNETQIDRITREIPANRPGRAVSLEKHHLMMGVPRLDGVHSADDIVAAIVGSGAASSPPHTRAGAAGTGAPGTHLPPRARPEPARTRCRLQSPVDRAAGHPRIGPLGRVQPHADDAAPADLRCPEVGQDAHSACRGSAICARNSPSQVRFMLADYRSGLLDAVPESHLLDAGAMNRNNATLEAAIKALAVNLQKRLPPPDLTTAQLRARSWWTGPDVVLLVDDWHMIVAASGVRSADGAAVPVVARGGGHRAAPDRHVPDEPSPPGHHGQVRRRCVRGGSPTMFLSGEKQEFPSSEIKLKRRPPGQAFLVTPDGKEVIQAAYVDPPEEEVSAAPLGGR